MLELIFSDVEKINIDLSKFKNKSVLITGASGIVGIYLLALLKSKKEELNIAIYTWHKNSNNLFTELFDGCTKIIADITENQIYGNLPEFDFIIHSAGYAQPGKFLSDKTKTIEINTSATLNLLNKLKKDGTFLFVSTSELYNGLEKTNIVENEIGTTRPDNSRSCYIESKRCGEAICHAFIEQGVNVKIARLSLAYGPGNQKNDTRVLYSLISKGILNDSIELMDSGAAIRTYCYITDVVEMFINIMLFGKEVTYNVGGNSIVSVFELANKIGKVLNKKINIPQVSNEMTGNPKIVNISIDKYIKEFNKQNFVSFDEGLKKTIKWQQELHERD